MTLAADIASDLDDVFFDEDEFAVAATYLPKGRESYSLAVIFEDPYRNTDMGAPGIVGVQTQSLYVTCKEANVVVGAGPGDQITIGANTFNVLTGEPDGNGLLTMHLQRVP